MTLRMTCSAMLAGIAISGCATPQTTGAGAESALTAIERDKQLAFVAGKRLDAMDRLAAISNDVMIANAAQCGPRITKTFGLVFSEAHDIDADGEKAAYREGRLSLPPVVRAASPYADPPAKVGDALVAIDGEPVISEEVLEALLARGAEKGGAAMTVARDGSELEVQAVPVVACDVPVELAWDADNNAFTDGDRIVMNRGILDMAESDDEVALVVAHELGHVASGHIEAGRENAIAGGAVGLLADIGMAALGVNTGGAFMEAGARAGRGAYSQDFEREADYVGAYFAANAGYSVDAGKQIWRSMGAASPGSLNFAGTHPTSPERYVALDNAAKEVAASEDGTLQPRNWTSRMVARPEADPNRAAVKGAPGESVATGR